MSLHSQQKFLLNMECGKEEIISGTTRHVSYIRFVRRLFIFTLEEEANSMQCRFIDSYLCNVSLSSLRWTGCALLQQIPLNTKIKEFTSNTCSKNKDFLLIIKS